MQRAARADIRGVRQITAEERHEIATSTPDTRAFLTVQMAEREHGGQRMPAWAIRDLEQKTRDFADALGRIAAERERVETRESTGQNGLGFTLEQLADEADASERPTPGALVEQLDQLDQAEAPAPAPAPAPPPRPAWFARGLR